MAYLHEIKKHSIPLAGMLIVTLIIGICAYIVSDGLGYVGLDSPHSAHVDQTNALLRGNLFISKDIAHLRADMVWHNDAVQQVWGLGVPALRLPFYALAHLFGYDRFPDLIIFFFYYCFVLFSAGIASYLWLKAKGVKRASLYSSFIMVCLGCFPPVLLIMKTRFIVYEEVITYGYLYVVFLFSLLLMLSLKKSSKTLFLLLCIMCGLAGFVRPTLFAYTFPICAAAIILVRQHLKLRYVVYGIIGGIMGIALLLTTNYVRFGAIHEFGHHVNVAGDMNSINLTRFESEYTMHTPFIYKMAETAGALFFIDTLPEPNGLYMPHIIPFQTEAIRWRHISFPAMHWFYLLIFGLMVMYARKNVFAWIPLASFIFLFLFYSHAFIISSRYLIDFAAAFALACMVMLMQAVSSTTKIRAFIAIGIIAAVYISGFISDVAEAQRPERRATIPSFSGIQTPNDALIRYEIGVMPGLSRFNGAGWNFRDGKLQTAAIFFVSRPEFIKLSLECIERDCIDAVSNFTAHLDGSELVLESSEIRDKNMTLVYNIPERLKNKSYIEILFIQTTTIGRKIVLPNVILTKLEWN